MLKNKILFTSSKYIAFLLKFIQGLYIAKYLGPSGLAYYGFSQLISLYVSFIHFGIPFSIHTLLSVSNNDDSMKVKTYISDAFSFLLLSGIVFCIIGGIAIFNYPTVFIKFHFYRYGILSIVIGVNLFIVQFFSNVYQVYGQYLRVALIEMASIIILFIAIFFYRGDVEYFLYNILLISALTIILSLFFFLYKAPFRIRFSLRKEVLMLLIRVGLPMLVSTVGFYLITFSVRSISNYQYSLHEIGLFTFALSISNAIMMGLNAISWTYYSTILANTCNDIESAYIYIQKVNTIYNLVLCISIFTGILFLPLLFYFLPEYEEFYNGISILLLSQIFMSISFGYSSLLIAQKKQNATALISFVTLAFTILLSIVVCIFNLPFLFQTIVILISMFFYSAQICYSAAKLCEKNFAFIFFKGVFTYKMSVPALILFIMILYNTGFWGYLSATLIFFVFNYVDIKCFLIPLLQRSKIKY